MNIWETRLISEDDQTEVGMRVGCALYAENNPNSKDSSYRLVCFRAKDAAAQRRMKEKNRGEAA